MSETLLAASLHGTGADGPLSLRERIQAQRAAIAAQHTVDVNIPGYRGELVARYRLLPATGRGSVDEIAQRVRQQVKGDMERLVVASIDVLVNACDGIYGRDPQSWEVIPIDPDGSGAVRYDPRLAEFLGFDDPGSAREVVRLVFIGPDGEPNEHAIVQHAARLQQWMSDQSIDPNEAM